MKYHSIILSFWMGLFCALISSTSLASELSCDQAKQQYDRAVFDTLVKSNAYFESIGVKDDYRADARAYDEAGLFGRLFSPNGIRTGKQRENLQVDLDAQLEEVLRAKLEAHSAIRQQALLSYFYADRCASIPSIEDAIAASPKLFNVPDFKIAKAPTSCREFKEQLRELRVITDEIETLLEATRSEHELTKQEVEEFGALSSRTKLISQTAFYIDMASPILTWKIAVNPSHKLYKPVLGFELTDGMLFLGARALWGTYSKQLLFAEGEEVDLEELVFALESELETFRQFIETQESTNCRGDQ